MLERTNNSGAFAYFEGPERDGNSETDCGEDDAENARKTWRATVETRPTASPITDVRIHGSTPGSTEWRAPRASNSNSNRSESGVIMMLGWLANDPGVQLRTHCAELRATMMLGAFVCCNGVLGADRAADLHSGAAPAQYDIREQRADC
jgi:hypothetical protein